MSQSPLTRFLILADTHDLTLTSDKTKPFRTPLPPDIDVVLHCGDLTENGGLQHHENALNMLAAMDAELKLVIPGNHEVDLDEAFLTAHGADTKQRELAMDLWRGDGAKKLGVHFLDEGVHHFTLNNGVSFSVYASPYTPEFGDSAFQYPTRDDRYNHVTNTPAYAKNVSTCASRVPDFPNVDIMMTHGPPKYIQDSCGNRSNGGCEHLSRAIARARPLLHCFGHIHGAWGSSRVAWKSQMSREEREELLLGERGYGGDDDNNNDDAYSLPKEFIGTNSCKKQGLAKVQAPDAAWKGKETLFINAAIGNEDGPVNAPWVVEMSLSQARGTKRKSPSI